MSLARRLMMSPGTPPLVAGQVQWTTPGSYDFEVPEGVFLISAVCVGGGNSGNDLSAFQGGGGAGLHWRNNVPVTPGETLTVVVGAKAAGSRALGGLSSIKRGATVLLLAEQAGAYILGGSGRFDLYGGGGGNGGRAVGDDGDGGYGGGAAGYTGNGGAGGSYATRDGAYPAPTDCGGGRGGDRNGIPTGWDNNVGEGVGLQGRTPDKAYGSLGTPKCGGGGPSPSFGGSPLDGGVRIMWGSNALGVRSYPDNAVDV